MAALPQSNTDRYYLDYLADTVNHTLVMRTQSVVTDAEAITCLDDLLTSLTGVMSGITIVNFRFSAAGSNVTNDIPWTADTEYGPGFSNRSNAPNFVSFTGRSADGRRTRVDLYGIVFAPDSNYRVEAADDTSIAAALAVIGNTSDGCFMSISGATPTWHQYANVSRSGYWVEQLRTS